MSLDVPFFFLIFHFKSKFFIRAFNSPEYNSTSSFLGTNGCSKKIRTNLNLMLFSLKTQLEYSNISLNIANFLLIQSLLRFKTIILNGHTPQKNFLRSFFLFKPKVKCL